MIESMPDLLLYNARVLTMDPKLPMGELVAVKGNRIHTVGCNRDVSSLQGQRTRLIDCKGMFVIPGFNDAHCHPISLALNRVYIDCSPQKTHCIADIVEQIGQRCTEAPNGTWIRAAGYSELQLEEKKHPNRWDLDRAAPDNPVILIHETGKTCVLNSLSLKLAGITRDTRPSGTGHIGKDLNSGEPDGIIFGLIDDLKTRIPPVEKEELLDGIKLVDEQYRSHGITAVHDTSWTNRLHHWKYYMELKGAHKLSPRVTMMVGSDWVEEFQQHGLSTRHGTERLTLGAVKIALDESKGLEHPSEQELHAHALRAHRAGFQLAFHVHDIQSLHTSISTIRFLAQSETGHPKRPRLEHCPVCPPEVIPKIKSHEAIVVTQPYFIHHTGDQFLRDVSTDALSWLFPLRTLMDHGVTTAISSDSPLLPFEPLKGIHAAVCRKTKSGREIAPGEALSVLDALQMYTISPAYASFEEGSRGTISPGKLADIAVLSDDPGLLKKEDMMRIEVVLTIIDGKVVWDQF